ncbi:hypothetical protein [Microbacterium sp. SS28]|uniref:hypothetical protein n=1 Tax=Microbacterium sp. SS28 TaxID=2919948 RepID=UPI001FA9B763|nr:hypothetical protein [Microbacterium sp. SS28]
MKLRLGVALVATSIVILFGATGCAQSSPAPALATEPAAAAPETAAPAPTPTASNTAAAAETQEGCTEEALTFNKGTETTLEEVESQTGVELPDGATCAISGPSMFSVYWVQVPNGEQLQQTIEDAAAAAGYTDDPSNPNAMWKLKGEAWTQTQGLSVSQSGPAFQQVMLFPNADYLVLFQGGPHFDAPQG